jgi:hypothetical protein
MTGFSDRNNSFFDAQFVGRLNTDLDVFGNVGGVEFRNGFYYTDRVDYFEFTVGSDRNVIISSDEEDVLVRIYDQNRRFIGTLLDDTYGSDYAQAKGYSQGLAVNLPEGLYYLRVSGNDFRRYEIDFDADFDSDYSLEDASDLGTINCSKQMSDQVGELDFADTYRFRLERSGEFTIRQTISGATGELWLYDDDEELIETGLNQIQADLEDDRDYYVRVFADDGANAQDYNLRFTPDPNINGTGDDDRLKGCKDDEVLKGFAGDDLLQGEGGKDELIGAKGNDRLVGGSGDDSLNGGRGNDVLEGGTGRDVFVLLGGKNSDRILDFQNGVDLLELPSRLSFNDLIISQRGQNTVIQAGKNPLALLVDIQASQITSVDFR